MTPTKVGVCISAVDYGELRPSPGHQKCSFWGDAPSSARPPLLPEVSLPTDPNSNDDGNQPNINQKLLFGSFVFWLGQSSA
jgi:hypothetical protein